MILRYAAFGPPFFGKMGYETVHIGKWHTGTDTGFGRDWDHQIVWNRPGYPKNSGAYYYNQLIERDVDRPSKNPATRPIITPSGPSII